MTHDSCCPLCGAAEFIPVLQRAGVPVHQNLVFRNQPDAIAIERGDLQICACAACGFVFNQSFDEQKLSYGAQYDNTQLTSPAFQEHVAGLVRHLIEERQVRSARIVEVGCGKGEFLRALVAAEGAENSGVGFDPSYVGPDDDLDGRLSFERRYYDATCTDIKVDVIVCRHVIEHVPDPLALLRTIRSAVSSDHRVRLFFETPCVEWILRKNVVWDFFYEHCSYFTAASLAAAFSTAGFTVERVSRVFGEQYLWLEATNVPPPSVTRDAGNTPKLARLFADAQERQLDAWTNVVRDLAGRQTLALWGAGAKGVTFANLVDPHRSSIACLVDMNPAKQGGFAAGSGHPIVAPQAMRTHDVNRAIVLNPNYLDEIREYVCAHGLSVEIVGVEEL